MRLGWVKLYQETGNAGYVCRRCGISRPTLRKWAHRYAACGIDGLKNQSKRPRHSPNAKVGVKEERLILELRQQRRLGARRIQNELKRLHHLSLALATIQKVLQRHRVEPVVKKRRKKDFLRYARPLPGDRVQMDTCKIGPGLMQYTAVDDCTRYRVLALFPRRTAAYTLQFLEQVIEEMPFPIQRIQTDRGREFFAVKVQQQLMEYGIKFRPVKPASPHLNGKVERSQKTDKEEFYSTLDLRDKMLEDRLAEWQHHYNWERPHGAHHGKAPMDKYFELSEQTPLWEDVLQNYDSTKERIQVPNYQVDLRMRKLKPSL